MNGDTETAAMEVLRHAVDGATARSVFGEPITHDGVMVIPVARILGSGGGGGGAGSNRGDAADLGTALPANAGMDTDLDFPAALDTGPSRSGTPGTGRSAGGTGAGLALSARPAGVFVVRDGKVAWRPAVDINKIVLGGQVVGVVALLTVRAVAKALARRRAERDGAALRGRPVRAGGAVAAALPGLGAAGLRALTAATAAWRSTRARSGRDRAAGNRGVRGRDLRHGRRCHRDG